MYRAAFTAATVTAFFVTVVAPIQIEAQAQPAAGAADAAFAVASVRRATRSGGSVIAIPGRIEPGGFVATNATLLQILRSAYPDYARAGRIIGGADWIGSEWFDITAKAEGEAPRDRIALMLRRLLAERFKLVVHPESRPFDVYALVVARPDGRLGPGLRPAALGCAAVRT